MYLIRGVQSVAIIQCGFQLLKVHSAECVGAAAAIIAAGTDRRPGRGPCWEVAVGLPCSCTRRAVLINEPAEADTHTRRQILMQFWLHERVFNCLTAHLIYVGMALVPA